MKPKKAFFLKNSKHERFLGRFIIYIFLNPLKEVQCIKMYVILCSHFLRQKGYFTNNLFFIFRTIRDYVQLIEKVDKKLISISASPIISRFLIFVVSRTHQISLSIPPFVIKEVSVCICLLSDLHVKFHLYMNFARGVL